MSTSALVSVVIPCYNAVPYIAATLESVFAQQGVNLEVILVDDGSQDGSSELASELLGKADFSHQIVHTTNGGPSRARNLGMARSSGEWIQFLDADDIIAAGKIELQARAARSSGPETSVIHSEWQSLDLLPEGWAPSGPIRRPVLGGDLLADLLQSDNFIHTGSCLFRRAHLQTIGGFDERHWLIEDVDLLLRLGVTGGKFQYTPGEGPVFYYRRHPDSLSRRDPAAFQEGCVRNVMLVEEHWRASDQLNVARAWQLAGHYHSAARYFAANDRRRFEELVRHIETLALGFLPSAPRQLRHLSRLVGYRRAELLSVMYRRAKAGAVRSTRRA